MATWAASFYEQAILSGRIWYVDTTLTILTGATASFAIDTGDIAPAIVGINIDTTILLGSFEVYESETYTGGTPATIHRINRNSAQVNVTTIQEGVTFTPTTDPIRDVPILGTRGEISVFDGSIGLVLKKNDTTIGRITNDDAQTKVVFMSLIFGESGLF